MCLFKYIYINSHSLNISRWRLRIIDIDSRLLNISRRRLLVIIYLTEYRFIWYDASYRMWKEAKLFVNCIISRVISHQKLKNIEFLGKNFIRDFLLNFTNVKVIYFFSLCCKTQNFSFSASGKKFVLKHIHKIYGSLPILIASTQYISPASPGWIPRQSSTVK